MAKFIMWCIKQSSHQLYSGNWGGRGNIGKYCWWSGKI